MREVIITTVYKDLTRKTIFLRGVLVSSSIIWTGTRYDLEILCSGGKRVKTKIWGLIPTLLEVAREKLIERQDIF